MYYSALNKLWFYDFVYITATSAVYILVIFILNMILMYLFWYVYDVMIFNRKIEIKL